MENIIITGGDDGLGRAIAKLLSEKNNVITISKIEENAWEYQKKYLEQNVILVMLLTWRG